MSKLLIQEKPLMIIPSLAVKIGLNESIILQQIHYWLVSSSHVIEGRKWIYNSYKDWQKQLPFWSESTIKRTIKSLEDQGYLISDNFNLHKMDKTKWYSIDYERLEELDDQTSTQAETSKSQLESMGSSNCDKEQGEMNQAIPEIPSEITTEITAEKEKIPYSEIIDYLNCKTLAAYKPTTKKTRDFIRARWREGFTLEDFKKVIDLKACEWLNDPIWSKYLRPETLFGAKFESYLNQKPTRKFYREEDFDLND
jgi:uncharacterized phage protein (TIGR02220 family)